jgi:carboxypeptidase Taq
MSTAHEQLAAELRRVAVLGSVASTIGWDEQTQLPSAGTDLRAEQSAAMARLVHEQRTTSKLGDLIAAAEDAASGAAADSTEACTAREARRGFDRATKLPGDLVEAIAKAEVVGHAAWVKARESDDFNGFAPHLDAMLGLKRQEADAVGHSGDRYEALLDDYEPGAKPAELDTLFAELKQPLIELVGRIKDSGKQAPRHILRQRFDVDAQRELSLHAARAFGFDFNAGRLDVAVHPFCTGLGPGDTRMTTRFVEDDVGNSFFSTLHETGHALYEQNLPKADHFGTGPADSVSLGIHESQSRMWENLVGRGEAFWDHFYPTAQQMFPDVLNDVAKDDFVFAANDVRPSFIRTESDEATYNLHVLLRFEIERALLSGDLATADLPGAWDEKMRDYLGVVPEKASDGCLQDVHWSAGLLGYFPTYTLGNVYSACLFDAATESLGGVKSRDAAFARGEFRPLLDWLINHVHRHGRRYDAKTLIENATGQRPTVQPLLRHLYDKAERFYGA